MECRKVQPLHICNFLNMRYFITSGYIGIPYLCCRFIWEEGDMNGCGGGGGGSSEHRKTAKKLINRSFSHDLVAFENPKLKRSKVFILIGHKRQYNPL